MSVAWWFHPGINQTPRMARPEHSRRCRCGRFWLPPGVDVVKAHGPYGRRSVGMAVHAQHACRAALVVDLGAWERPRTP